MFEFMTDSFATQCFLYLLQIDLIFHFVCDICSAVSKNVNGIKKDLNVIMESGLTYSFHIEDVICANKMLGFVKSNQLLFRD